MDSNSQPANDAQLITDARSDPAAFAQLYRRHYDTVFHYCVHRLFERHAAEDVISEVFFKVVQNFRRFKGSERQFRNWLYKIATNAVNNHLRQAARRNSMLKAAREDVGRRSAGRQAPADENAEKLALLKQTVSALKPRYQTIITLRFFENLKLTEIAEVLDSSTGTVRSQLARALAKLQKKITTAQQEV